jgi:hypothetical protein
LPLCCYLLYLLTFDSIMPHYGAAVLIVNLHRRENIKSAEEKKRFLSVINRMFDKLDCSVHKSANFPKLIKFPVCERLKHKKKQLHQSTAAFIFLSSTLSNRFDRFILIINFLLGWNDKSFVGEPNRNQNKKKNCNFAGKNFRIK